MIEKLERLTQEIHKVIIGQEALIERLLIALLSDGHVLLEGVPGLAKTKALTSLTACLSTQMARVQFTPDLLPSDLIGTEVYRPAQSEFVIRQGPVFTNLLLADEINRAPAKVQSALLQAMQERQVTIGERTFALPKPFLVLATQNPIEQEGTYPLPEAQLDRFLMKVKVSYPSFEEEMRILSLSQSEALTKPSLEPVLGVDEILEMRKETAALYVDPKVDRYIVSLARATREPVEHNLEGLVEWGVSPRASIALRSCAQSLAYLQGDTHTTPDHVKAVAPDVLRHRLVLSLEAEARGVTSDEIITTLLLSVTVP